MLVVDLQCAQGHLFEGWFASADDLSSQRERGILSCPDCGGRDVVRRPSAPHLNTSGLRERPAEVAPSAMAERDARQARPSAPMGKLEQAGQAGEVAETLQSLYLQAVRHVLANTEDVGARFADEARSIHHGEAPPRAIRGQASPEERAELAQEGIDVLALPVPDELIGPLH